LTYEIQPAIRQKPIPRSSPITSKNNSPTNWLA
jgi:hypothetical protein